MFKNLVINSGARRTFHSCKPSLFKIPFLPALPQVPGGVKGNVNEAFVPPKVDKLHGSYHWDFERIIAVSVLPLVTLPVLTSGSPLGVGTDMLLATAGMLHFMVEFQSCIIDYVSRRMYGKFHYYAMYLLYGGSVLSLFGIYSLQKEDEKTKKNIGMVGFVSKFFGSKQVQA